MGIVQTGIINHTVTMLSEKSIAEKLEMASLNTLLGMGTVFVVLIFISILISLFKFIPSLQEKLSGNANAMDNPVDKVIDQIVEQEEEENLSGDLELVAVITAAIYAAMEENTVVPADGLIVRSIRRV